MNRDVRWDVLFISLGLAAGSSWYAWRQGKAIKKLIEQNNMKTQMINWIVNEGMELPESEFVAQFMIRREFINMSLTI